jgi:hypothetical protein
MGSHTNVPWTRRIKVNSLPVSYWTFWAFKTYPKMLADPLTITWGWRFLATLIAVIIVVRVRSWLRLRHIPGPPFAAFSKLWLLRKTSGGRFHLDTAEACEKYGIVLVLQSLRRSSLLILNSPGLLYELVQMTSWPTILRFGERYPRFGRHIFVRIGIMVYASIPIMTV